MVEQRAFNPLAVGSSPTDPTKEYLQTTILLWYNLNHREDRETDHGKAKLQGVPFGGFVGRITASMPGWGKHLLYPTQRKGSEVWLGMDTVASYRDQTLPAKERP